DPVESEIFDDWPDAMLPMSDASKPSLTLYASRLISEIADVGVEPSPPKLFAVRPEPESDPVGLVPPLPLGPSFSPTVRPTDTTFAAYGATSRAPARLVLAWSSASCAVVTFDRSAVSRLADAP